MISWQAQYFWNMLPFSWKSRTKRSFWKSGASVFEEISHKTLVLEVRIFNFRGSLVQNTHFGAPDLQFSRKSRTKRSFWKSGASVFEEVSHKTLVLEVRIFSFRGSLVQNTRFGAPDLQFSRKSRTKRSFWKSGSSVFEEVSHKTLILEVRIFSFRGSLAQNSHFGSPDLQFSRKSRTKRSFWKSGASVFEEVSHKMLVLEVRIFSFRGSLVQNTRFGAPDLQFSRKSRTKRSFWKSGASVFEEVSHKTLVLEVRSFSFRGSLVQNTRFGAPDLQFSRKSRRICSFTISWCKWPKSGS